jgi:hypothetical protein
MTRATLEKHRIALPALVAAIAAAALGGCGGEARTDAPEARPAAPTTNGLEKLSAAEVQRRAVAALRAATSAHVRGATLDAGSSFGLDLRIGGTATAGTVTAGGERIAIRRLGGDVYVRATRVGLEKLGAPGWLRRRGAGRWVKLAPEQLTAFQGFSLDDFADQLAANASPRSARVARATVGGKPVVIVTQKDGSKLFVSNTGAPLPVGGVDAGPPASRVEFSDYGADYRITAPSDSLDVGKLLQEAS